MICDMKNGQMTTTLVLYNIDSVTYGRDGSAEAEEEDGMEKPDKMTRLRQYFATSGTKKTIRAIMLAFQHGHPYLLLLDKKSQENSFKLPGGTLEVGEDFETGLGRILEKKLGLRDGYEIVDQLVATWNRPLFTEQMLPYCPVHISTPKEVEEWYVVRLPERAKLYISSKYDLRMTSFYDLQSGADRFGEQLSKIPVLISRFNLIQE